jgi:hypothetical protein
VGGHRGGNTPFRLDISDAVAAEEIPGARNDLMAHELLVRVEDSSSNAQLRGKQVQSVCLGVCMCMCASQTYYIYVFSSLSSRYICVFKILQTYFEQTQQ